MELQGKIIAALEARSGDSKRNPGEKWMSQEFVLEYQSGQYPRKMVFNVWGADRLQRYNIQVGGTYSVSFDIDAREWNGRWFSDIRAFDVRPFDPAATGENGAAQFPPEAVPPFAPAPQAAPQTDPFAAAESASPMATKDDLPF